MIAILLHQYGDMGARLAYWCQMKIVQAQEPPRPCRAFQRGWRSLPGQMQFGVWCVARHLPLEPPEKKAKDRVRADKWPTSGY